MEKEKLTAGFNEELEVFIRGLGLELFGFTDSDEILKGVEYYRKRPEEYHSAFEAGTMEEKCRTTGRFISIAFPYAHSLNWNPKAHFSVYTRGRDYHVAVRAYLEQIAGFIRELGWQAEVYTDSNKLPERLIAALAGLGYLGRNSTLITKEFGSYVFLGEIYTDLPLKISRAYTAPGDYTLCGDCLRCVKACPAGILGKNYVDASRCLSELTQNKKLTGQELLLLNGRLFGCDTCQQVCPHNKGRENLGLMEFKPLQHMIEPDLTELVFLTKETFRRKYQSTSAGWRGKALLGRNALAALAQRSMLPENAVFESPMLTEAYEQLKALTSSPSNSKTQNKNENNGNSTIIEKE